MKYKHKEPEIKKKKPRKHPKKNNAHLVNKDKLHQQAKDLEMELVFKQKSIKKHGQKHSNTKHYNILKSRMP